MVDFSKHLKARIKDISAQSAPSLVPAPRAPRAEPPPEIIPDVTEVFSGAELAKVRRLVTRLTELRLLARPIDREIEETTEALKDLLPKEKLKVRVGETPLSYYATSRASINKQMLLDQGVAPTTIAAATLIQENWTLRVSLPKDEEFPRG